MLELSKVQHLAETYAPQELFAALVWQRQFNLVGLSPTIPLCHNRSRCHHHSSL